MNPQRRLQLPAVLTQREAPAAVRAIGLATGASAAGAAVEWRLDASALADFDSSALAVLLACKRQANAAQASLVVEGAPAKLIRLAELYGLDELLGVGTASGRGVLAAPAQGATT